MDEKKVIQLSDETFNSLMKASEAVGYQRGVKDNIFATRLGMGIVLLGWFGAIVAHILVEKHKEQKQKQTENISE